MWAYQRHSHDSFVCFFLGFHGLVGFPIPPSHGRFLVRKKGFIIFSLSIMMGNRLAVNGVVFPPPLFFFPPCINHLLRERERKGRKVYI